MSSSGTHVRCCIYLHLYGLYFTLVVAFGANTNLLSFAIKCVPSKTIAGYKKKKAFSIFAVSKFDYKM